MEVKLISITPDAEKLIAYCARVSNPNGQDRDDYSKLIAYCIKNQHWSIFEQGYMTLEITTTRAIAAQILRHRSFTFQEFCMSGDTNVYFDLPNAIKKGKRQKYSLTLEHLYKNWSKNENSRNRIRNMFVRVYDEISKTLSHAHIKEVFQTGMKDIFEIVLENGKSIKCTKEHKVLTKNGFVSLQDATGLKLVGNTAVISNNIAVGCNGTPVHQDYNWLLEHKKQSISDGTGLVGIANTAGVSIHTIRKWLKKHNLCFTKKEVSSYTPIWNKGVFGYSSGLRSEETKQKMRDSSKKGKDSNLWKGGVAKERQKIQADISKFRNKLMKEYNYCCGMCGDKLNSRTHLHHIIPVSENMSLAREYSNLMPVHSNCHMKHHRLNGDHKKWKEKGIGNTMTVSWSKIKFVKYIGKEMTYDLEIDHDSHNYVADGVIVHNSQRYADAKLLGKIECPDIRSQDNKNRQNSIDDIQPHIKNYWKRVIEEHFYKSARLYESLLKDGVAKECARFVLPLATPTKLYMTGSIRSWIHYIELRSSNGTQKEHMDIANSIKQIFVEQLPIISEALDWK